MRGEVDVPDGYTVLEGTPLGNRRSVGVVVSRFNGGLTNRMLAARARRRSTRPASRRTRSRSCRCPARSSCRSRRWRSRRRAATPASSRSARSCAARRRTSTTSPREARPGLQLAAIETGVPVAFGVLTVDDVEQAEARIDQAAEAVRTALEMADLFAQLAGRAPRPSSRLATLPRRDVARSAQSAARSPAFGNNRSHSMVATKRRFDPNLQRVRMLLEGRRRRAPTSAPAASRAARCRRPSSKPRARWPSTFGV